VPDLNSGNILYKAIEQFGGYTAAGPILQGFRAPISDLSRGSTKEDVLAVIDVELKLVAKNA
jgi:phosphate acetyltransferase